MQQLNNLKKSLRNSALLSMVVSKLEVVRSMVIIQPYELYYIFGFVEFEELSSMHSALEVQSNFELLIL